MLPCRLRAVDCDGNPHIFHPEDVPVRTFDDTFILANVPNSRALAVSSVVRVMDHMDVGEGDRVDINGTQYTVQYIGGFHFRSDDGVIIRSNKVVKCKVLSVGMKTVSRIQFRSPNMAFQLRAFIGVYEGKIVTAHDKCPFKPEELRVSAGVTYLQHKLCYGDIVEGEKLTMWRGRPCIKVDGCYIEIPSKIQIGKDGD